MNGVVLLAGGLLLVAVIKLIIDRNWIGLLLCAVALLLVFGAGHHLSLCLFGYAVPELQEELEMPRLYPD